LNAFAGEGEREREREGGSYFDNDSKRQNSGGYLGLVLVVVRSFDDAEEAVRVATKRQKRRSMSMRMANQNSPINRRLQTRMVRAVTVSVLCSQPNGAGPTTFARSLRRSPPRQKSKNAQFANESERLPFAHGRCY
jgi:hypothetical protein